MFDKLSRSITTKQVSDADFTKSLHTSTCCVPPRAAPRLCKPIIGNYGRIVNHANAPPPARRLSMRKKIVGARDFSAEIAHILFVCYFSLWKARVWIWAEEKSVGAARPCRVCISQFIELKGFGHVGRILIYNLYSAICIIIKSSFIAEIRRLRLRRSYN